MQNSSFNSPKLESIKEPPLTESKFLLPKFRRAEKKEVDDDSTNITSRSYSSVSQKSLLCGIHDRRNPENIFDSMASQPRKSLLFEFKPKNKLEAVTEVVEENPENST